MSEEIKKLLEKYNVIENKTLEDIIEFHKDFEIINPIQDCNGGGMITDYAQENFKHNIVSFIKNEQYKLYYDRSLCKWNREEGLLIETGLLPRNQFKRYLDCFRVGR